MAYNFVGLVNRLCAKFGEVPLDATTFASADGVYSEFKNAINGGISDIYTKKNNEWPFGWQENQFVTSAGTGGYTKVANATNIDWDSFQIIKKPMVVTSLTRSGTTATAIVASGHNLLTDDRIYITGATQPEYNGLVTITVTSPTAFTFEVANTAVTPATGTIYCFPPYNNKYLEFMDYDAYRQEGYQKQDDDMFMTGQYTVPARVVRKPDNNFIISPKPDRPYYIQYDSFSLPAVLVNHNDVPQIPEQYEELVVAASVWWVYMFRDNFEQAAISDNRYKELLENVARMLIPQQTYARIVD